ncbi:MAG TPA: U32 family peptidase, partial [Gammaproteobacteria bacterium]|nr:U32 family peptidase [Gammaproteobacteria bacterium]
RWDYGVHQAQETDTGDVMKAEGVVRFDPKTLPREEIVLLEEGGRPGELMPMFEDEHGTYIMNSKDLRAVQHVQRLMEIGIDSLKIEGRTKSHYYTARTAQIYRQAIKDGLDGKSFDMGLMTSLDGLANRGYTEGFYRRHVPEEYQNYEQGNSISTKQKFVGEVSDYDTATGKVSIEVKNKFSVGDSLEIMFPGGSKVFTLESMEDLKGNDMSVAKGSGYRVKIDSPVENPGMGLLMVNV